MTTTDAKRQDLPPDPYARIIQSERVRDPRRADGSATIPATRPQRRMAVRVFGDTNQTIANATETAILWPFEEFDTAGLHSTTANTERLVIPSTGLVTGLWLFHTSILWEGNATGERFIRFYEQGSLVSSVRHTPGTTGFFSQELTRYVLDPRPGYVYEIRVNQTSGGVLDVLAGASYFEAIHIW